MTKKNRKAKIDNVSAENESVEQKLDLTESTSMDAKREADRSNLDQDTVADEGDGASDVETPVTETSDVSVDDLLDDVRRSLIEDAAQDDEKKSSWWNKKGKGKSKDQTVDVAAQTENVAANEPIKDDTEYLEQIDELINLLEPEDEASKGVAVAKTATAPVPEPVEPEAAIDMDELKKRVFSPSEAGKEQEITEVRSIALEGGEDIFVEVEAKKSDPAEERWKAFENSLKPYQRYINYVIAFLGVVAIVLVSVLMYSFYLRNKPAEPVKAVSNLPFPTSMTLPGGLNFRLGKGALKDGTWNPRGPEWLEGTEICRWVAIPWSRQLEAVVRTLTQKDTIELGMSNNDKLTYNVYSIKEMTLVEMQKLDSNSPCMLLVLAKQDSDKRWVVTAMP
jgi:hypothetical protein